MYTNTSKLECSIPISVIPVVTSMYIYCMYESVGFPCSDIENSVGMGRGSYNIF